MIPRLLATGLALVLAILAVGCAAPRIVRPVTDALAGPPPAPVELQWLETWVVDLPEGVSDLSGLVWSGGKLLTVSDKVSDRIFEIVPPRQPGAAARLRTYLELDLPPLRRTRGEPDFEGITADTDGNLYVVEERYSLVLSIAPDGSSLGWMEMPNIDAAARSVGLLATDGAGFEGIAWVAPGQFYFAAERLPRGLLYLVIDRFRSSVRAEVMERSVYPPVEPGRSVDFGDLAFDGATLFALQRNAEVITPLVSAAGGRIDEGPAWSYRATAALPEYRYRDSRFGLAEGLAVTADRVYVLLDNNRDERTAHPGDTRPVLWVFRRP